MDNQARVVPTLALLSVLRRRLFSSRFYWCSNECRPTAYDSVTVRFEYFRFYLDLLQIGVIVSHFQHKVHIFIRISSLFVGRVMLVASVPDLQRDSVMRFQNQLRCKQRLGDAAGRQDELVVAQKFRYHTFHLVESEFLACNGRKFMF